MDILKSAGSQEGSRGQEARVLLRVKAQSLAALGWQTAAAEPSPRHVAQRDAQRAQRQPHQLRASAIAGWGGSGGPAWAHRGGCVQLHRVAWGSKLSMLVQCNTCPQMCSTPAHDDPLPWPAAGRHAALLPQQLHYLRLSHACMIDIMGQQRLMAKSCRSRPLLGRHQMHGYPLALSLQHGRTDAS